MYLQFFPVFGYLDFDTVLSRLTLLMGQEVLLQTLLFMGIIDEILPSYQIEIAVPADMPQCFTELSGLYANTTCVKRMTVQTDGTSA